MSYRSIHIHTSSIYNIIFTDFKNTFINISIEAISSTVICTFLKDTNTLKTCSISYDLYNGSKSQCGVKNFDLHQQLLNERQYIYAQSTSNHIIIGLPYVSLPHHDNKQFCFTVFASNGTHIALIEGIFTNKIWSDSLHHNRKTYTVKKSVFINTQYAILKV